MTAQPNTLWEPTWRRAVANSTSWERRVQSLEAWIPRAADWFNQMITRDLLWSEIQTVHLDLLKIREVEPSCQMIKDLWWTEICPEPTASRYIMHLTKWSAARAALPTKTSYASRKTNGLSQVMEQHIKERDRDHKPLGITRMLNLGTTTHIFWILCEK